MRRAGYMSAAVMVAVLAGCAPVGTGTVDEESPTPSATEEHEAESDLAWYPAEVGTTWVYRSEYSPEILAMMRYPSGVAISTETLTAVTPDGDDLRLTIETGVEFEDADFDEPLSTSEIVLHVDGSAALVITPIIPSPDSTARDEVVLPTPEQFDSGEELVTSSDSTGVVDGQSLTTTTQLAVMGSGTGSVTVPAGVFATRILDVIFNSQQDTLIGESIGTGIITWEFSPGVGLVREDVRLTVSSGEFPVSTRELISFTPGG